MQPNSSIRKISQCTYPVQGIMQARHTSISPMPSKRNNKQQSTKSYPANSHVRLTNISDTGSVSIIRLPIWLLGIQSYQEADNGLLESPDTAGSPRLTEFCHYKPSRDTQILLVNAAWVSKLHQSSTVLKKKHLRRHLLFLKHWGVVRISDSGRSAETNNNNSMFTAQYALNLYT